MLLEKLPEIVAEAEDEEGDGGTRDVAGAAGTGDGSFAQARLMCDWVVEKTEARSLAMKVAKSSPGSTDWMPHFSSMRNGRIALSNRFS